MAAGQEGDAKRVLITGANGFVGPYLAAELRALFGNSLVLRPTSLIEGAHPVLGQVHALDVTNSADTARAVSSFKPTHVVHLAGLAAVTMANANPELAWGVHLGGTQNVIEAILGQAPECVLIFVGSGQVYGATAKLTNVLDERSVLAPANSYELTKAAADLAVGANAGRGLRSIRMRPFNHTGPGQTGDFAVPNFAMQIARIEAGLERPVVRVGNLEAIRDFLDVRDVTRAYGLAIARSGEIAPGTILNIASGVPRRISDVLERLIALARVPIRIERDEARMRPSDTPRFVGDAARAKEMLGWVPAIAFDDTLADVLDACRSRIAATA